MSIIPYGRQDINQSDIEAVTSVLKSDFLTQGPIVPAFESALASYVGVKYAVAVNSATSALHIACLALGVGKGDIVWTVPNTFVASANAALYCGATIDFVDIDTSTFNISVQSLSDKLEQAKKSRTLPKVVIPVHFAGQSCDMDEIHSLSKRYGFKVIEDASHAIGAKYQGESIGISKYSDLTVFSFHPVKIITTGEGGMVVTNSEELAKQLRLLRSHGITYESLDMESRNPQEIWNYQQVELGYNYRMTDLQAALGLSQLKRLDEFIVNRRLIASHYDSMLHKLPIIIPRRNNDCYSSFHLYVIRLQLEKMHKTQRQVYDQLREAGVMVNLHYIPVYRQPYYERLGFKKGYCPQSEKCFLESISIPIFQSLSAEDQNRVVRTLFEVLE